MSNVFKPILAEMKRIFNALPDKRDEEEIVKQIQEGVSFRGATIWVLAFAILIASLGLNVNSTAVIIGAMLISPLMGPIIGMGLAIGTQDDDLLRRAMKNYLVATLVSICVATLYFLLTPISEAQSELLARTSPSLYDVLIALCGGAAGIVAMCTKGNANVVPGVAIATALMPPLCTAGYGLATGNLQYFFGAFYLYFINTVFICVATVVGVRLFRFRHRHFVDAVRNRRMLRYVWGVVVATMLPAVWTTTLLVRQNMKERSMLRFISEQLAQKGTQLMSHTMDEDAGVIRVVAVGKEISAERQQSANENLEHYGLEKYRLEVYQGTRGDSVMLEMLRGQQSQQRMQQNEQMEAVRSQLRTQVEQSDRLEQQLDAYLKPELLTQQLGDELQPLFPQVGEVSVARVRRSFVGCDSTAVGISVHVTLCPGERLAEDDREKLHKWMQSRCPGEEVNLYVQELPATQEAERPTDSGAGDRSTPSRMRSSRHGGAVAL